MVLDIETADGLVYLNRLGRSYNVLSQPCMAVCVAIGNGGKAWPPKNVPPAYASTIARLKDIKGKRIF